MESRRIVKIKWDANPAREQGEAAIREIFGAKTLEEPKRAAARLRALSKPFLNWASKADRLSFEVISCIPLRGHA